MVIYTFFTDGDSIMNILVSGGAGYIGSVTTEELIRAGHRVVVIDNLSRGHKQALHDQAQFVYGDIGNAALVEPVIRQHEIEAVIHFAADALVGESMENPAKYFDNNVMNGYSLVKSAAANGVKKFIFSSTCATYGEPNQIPIPETHLQQPCNPYGESKLILEKIISWFQQIHGMDYVFLRYFNACGASEQYGEDHTPETHLIPIILEVAAGEREELLIMGDDYNTPDGTCIRDYIHVLDLAQAHIRALDYAGSAAFNLGNSQGFSVREVHRAAEEVTGKPIKTRMVTRRPGDPATLIGASEKVRNELGWNPRFADLHAMIESAWRWKLRHPHGYDE